MTASAAPVGPAASCACSASCTRSASGKPTCMITLRARRPRPRRAAAFVERSPDACEHALVWLLAALHSQGSKQERNQPACTTRRPARLAVLARRAISRLRVRCQPDTARRAWHSRGLRPREGGPPGERAAWPAEVRASPRVQPADVCRRVMRRSAQSWQHLAGQCRPRPPLWRRAGRGRDGLANQPAARRPRLCECVCWCGELFFSPWPCQSHHPVVKTAIVEGRKQTFSPQCWHCLSF